MMAETRTRAEQRTTRKTATKAAEAPREAPKEEPKAAPPAHVCNVAFCPIGLALSTVQGAAPDVLEHMLKAAQEFLLAAKAVIDNRAKDFEDEPDKSNLERIEIK
jgi:hypothetical protein